VRNGRQLRTKVRYYSSVSTIYVLTLLFAVTAFAPLIESKPANSYALTNAVQKPYAPAPHNVSVISGRPVRIVLPASNVDLPVDEGYYDSQTGGWTLSGYRAQFAMISTLANNVAGDTFIYGHNNDHVFGALRHVTPAPGAQALIYTDNGHIFEYSFVKSFSLAPDETSVLSYSGPPIMTIQTCTGSVNEWRTMYRYSFVKVVQ
jgi:hypothetical protein